jgi:aspartate/methionine/tyrosine aminotransferase
VPGQAFGAEGHVRISFAGADAEVEEGVTRLAKAFAELDGD